jgi:hypothetical protein
MHACSMGLSAIARFRLVPCQSLALTACQRPPQPSRPRRAPARSFSSRLERRRRERRSDRRRAVIAVWSAQEPSASAIPGRTVPAPSDAIHAETFQRPAMSRAKVGDVDVAPPVGVACVTGSLHSSSPPGVMETSTWLSSRPPVRQLGRHVPRQRPVRREAPRGQDADGLEVARFRARQIRDGRHAHQRRPPRRPRAPDASSRPQEGARRGQALDPDRLLAHAHHRRALPRPRQRRLPRPRSRKRHQTPRRPLLMEPLRPLRDRDPAEAPAHLAPWLAWAWRSKLKPFECSPARLDSHTAPKEEAGDPCQLVHFPRRAGAIASRVRLTPQAAGAPSAPTEAPPWPLPTDALGHRRSPAWPRS